MLEVDCGDHADNPFVRKKSMDRDEDGNVVVSVDRARTLSVLPKMHCTAAMTEVNR